MVAYSRAMLATAPQHPLAGGGLLPGGAVAGLQGHDQGAQTGVGRVEAVEGGGDVGVNVAGAALELQCFDFLGPAHIRRGPCGSG